MTGAGFPFDLAFLLAKAGTHPRFPGRVHLVVHRTKNSRKTTRGTLQVGFLSDYRDCPCPGGLLLHVGQLQAWGEVCGSEGNS
jgi:hypothetical protein